MGRLSKQAIREYADKVRAHHDLGEPVDLTKLSDALRLTFLERSGPYQALPNLIFEEDRIFVLRNVYQGKLAARRELAHNIGHIYLHHLLPGLENTTHVHRCGTDAAAEHDANLFADWLMLPNQLLAPFLLDRVDEVDVHRIARHFDVGSNRVEERLQELNQKAVKA